MKLQLQQAIHFFYSHSSLRNKGNAASKKAKKCRHVALFAVLVTLVVLDLSEWFDVSQEQLKSVFVAFLVASLVTPERYQCQFILD